MNCICLSGRTTEKPQVRYVPTGNGDRPVTEFNLAVDDYQNKGPDGKPRSYFFRLVIWGNKAEAAAQYLVKGQKIAVQGRLTQQEYTKKGTDEKRQSTRIIVDSFDIGEKPLSHRQEDTRPPQQGSTSTTRDTNPPPADEPDDIPF